MSDCVDDYYATIGMIIQNYRDLKKVNKTHELLSLLEDLDDSGFTRTAAFKKKYSSQEKGHKTHLGRVSAALRRYHCDIEKALKEGLIELLKEHGEKTEEEIWKYLEEKELVATARVHLTHNIISLTDFLKFKKEVYFE
jgi:hypothetical protein